MSTLINLIISLIMGLLFGNQLEEPKTAHHEFNKQSVKIILQLETTQKILYC